MGRPGSARRFFRRRGAAGGAPAARRLSRLLLPQGPASEQALAACGPRFYEGCGLGKRALPSKKGKTHEGLAFFLTRRLLKKAGENF
ncbi:hypothetical protein ANACOL_03743 [Anaerotruncus colihominis DSM 17241]|uniref:Uncharacterized protein n=1 Tax=Anaerotruncus colihominis DSM 17241 TaxID=445972 RepID=B0PG11_9FIRM|nr:hypothetical protein ANACOL_03743 [Anaerotruncus colihominis DSM 17241]